MQFRISNIFSECHPNPHEFPQFVLNLPRSYREYWIIYRGLDFLAVVWFGCSPTPLSRQQVFSLSQSSCVSPVKLTDGRGGGGWGRDGRGAKSYDREKACHSVNYSILRGVTYMYSTYSWKKCSSSRPIFGFSAVPFTHFLNSCFLIPSLNCKTRICKFLKSPGSDTEALIPPAYVASARIVNV